jgi:hypothetical protein
MSYVATLAIVTVWRIRRSADDADHPRLFGRALWFRIGRCVQRPPRTTSLAAQLALAPLLLYYFGTFSWAGIGANMVAVPLSGLCLWSGAVLAFLDSAWPWAASIWAVPTQWGAEALVGWARLWAKIPGAQLYWSINGPQTVALFVGIGGVFAALTCKWRRISIPLLGTVTAAAVWALNSPHPQTVWTIEWRGGRNPSVQVQTETEKTVFEKKQGLTETGPRSTANLLGRRAPRSSFDSAVGRNAPLGTYHSARGTGVWGVAFERNRPGVSQLWVIAAPTSGPVRSGGGPGGRCVVGQREGRAPHGRSAGDPSSPLDCAVDPSVSVDSTERGKDYPSRCGRGSFGETTNAARGLWR